MTDPTNHRTTFPNPAPLVAATLLIGLWLAAAPPLRAEPPTTRWIVRGYAVSLSQIDDRVTVTRSSPTMFEETTHSVSGGSGFGLSLERMLRRNIGVELAVRFADLEHDFRLASASMLLSDREETDTETFSLGANYHFTPERQVDLFMGGFVAMGTFDDAVFLTEAGRSEKLTFDDDFGFGVKAGVDVRLRPEARWRFTAEVRYLVTILESELPGQDLDLNPVVLTAGIGYGF